jgi:hypothetical protein
MRNTDTTDALNDRDARIVALTLAGKSPAQCAAELDCAISTVYRRLQTPHVRVALAEARAGEVRPLVERALTEAQKSVERLVQVRDGELTRDGDRIRAACALLTWFKDMYELSEVMPRLAALEGQLAARTLDGRDADASPNTPHCGAVPPGLVEGDTELA